MEIKVVGRPIEILLVEDSPGDVRLTVETFRDGKIRNNLHVAWDGVEAMSYLRKNDPYTNATRPDLISCWILICRSATDAKSCSKLNPMKICGRSRSWYSRRRKRNRMC